MPQPFDEVQRPAHYCYSDLQPLDVAEKWDLPFHLACVVKYLARYRHKGQPILDLRKAIQYLQRYVELLERQSAATKPRKPRRG